MSSDSGPSFLHYALGGGLGHLVRQLAIAQSLQKQTASQSKSTVVANSEFAPTVAQLITKETRSRVQFELLSPDCLPAEAERVLDRLLACQQFDCLIVDVFPRGLGGELVSCFGKHSVLPKVLVARNLPSAYLRQFQVESFVRKNFCRVLRIEPAAPFESLPQSQLTCPVVFSSEPTVSDSNAVQRRHRKVLVVGSGTNTECLALRKLTDDLRKLTNTSAVNKSALPCEFEFHGPSANSSDDQFHWPPSSQLAGFDLVIGNAGYNLYWETQLAPVPAVLFAQPRKYDDQTLRSQLQWPIPTVELFDLIQSKLNNASTSSCHTPLENSIGKLTASILQQLEDR